MARLKNLLNALLTRISPNPKVQTAALGGMMVSAVVLFFILVAMWPPLLLLVFSVVVLAGLAFGVYLIAYVIKDEWLDS